MLPSEVGAALRVARKRAGLSLVQVSARCSLDRSYVARLERAERAPTASTVEALADVLDLDDELRARLEALAV